MAEKLTLAEQVDLLKHDIEACNPWELDYLEALLNKEAAMVDTFRPTAVDNDAVVVLQRLAKIFGMCANIRHKQRSVSQGEQGQVEARDGGRG